MLMNGPATPRVPARRVGLGAIELIELGSSVPRVELPYRADFSRRPFLSSRYPRTGPALGQLDFLKSVGSFLTGAFEFIFKNLAALVNVPLNLASQGVGVLFDGLAGFLRNIPIIGVLAAELLLVGKAVIQFGLSVPGLLLSGIGNIFGEVKKAIDATKTVEQKKTDEKKAEENILKKAEEKGGAPLKNAVGQAIAGQAPSNTTPPPNPPNPLPPGAQDVGTQVGQSADLQNALSVGLPIAGAAALAFMILR